MKTVVIFRRDNFGTTAVFPYEVERDGSMLCYSHIGQHSTCSYEWYAKTKPCSDDNLKSELESIGYDLSIAKRIQYRKYIDAYKNSRLLMCNY